MVRYRIVCVMLLLFGAAACTAAIAGEARRVDSETVSALAERFMNPELRKQAESENFIVTADAWEPQVPDTLASNLEVVFRILDGARAGGEQVRSGDRGKVRVYLYGYEESFRRFCGIAGRDCESSSGFYIPEVGVMVFHMEMGSIESLLGVMFHECVHAYVDRRIARPGVSFPAWLNEGLAEYVENSRFHRGKLALGRFCKKTLHRTSLSERSYPSFASVASRQLRRLARRSPETLSLEQLFRTNPANLKPGRKTEQFYARSWMLVNFLRHGREGWAVERFPRLLLEVGKGRFSREALEEAYGASLDEIERDYIEFILDFRPTRCNKD